MKKELLCFTLYVIIIYLTSSTLNPVIAITQPSGEHETHFCGVSDYHPLWRQHSKRQENRNYARTFANLNVGAPRTVRLIYFLPNDRPYSAEMVQEMKDTILKVQTFYAEQMEAHGYGRQTFRIETDLQGEPKVHRVEEQQPNSDYQSEEAEDVDANVMVVEEQQPNSDYQRGNEGDWLSDIEQAGFDSTANVYLIAMDLINDGGGIGGRRGKNGGEARLFGNVWFTVAAHELGHAFGLQHDFRDGAYIMSYGPGPRDRLSQCHAEYLSVHPYFNPNTPIEEGPAPRIELLSPRTYTGGERSVPIQLEISDSDGLLQVILHAAQPYNRWSVKSCRGVRGRNRAVIEFDYDGVIPSAHDPVYSRSTSLLNPLVHPITIEAIDTKGNVDSSMLGGGFNFLLFSETLEPLSKISGDNLQGLPNTPLPVPFVVESRDLNNGFARGDVWVTFTVTAGGGTLSVERVKTDYGGRAESTLTLGPNFGTNTVEVSAEGLTVTFNAVAGVPVDIPDVNLRAAIEDALGVMPGTPIAPADMATLSRLKARNANISDLTGLEHAINLTRLDLADEYVEAEGDWINSNSVSDLSPLSGLTNLTHLWLQRNPITDISALAGLINLTELLINYTTITDLSPLSGLTNLTWLHLKENNITDISALAGLTNLTRLELGNNNITDISPLSSLTNLTDLSLDSNNITDISVLAGLPNLIDLALGYNAITDHSILSGLTNLIDLDLRGTNTSDLSVLSRLTKLERLYIDSNGISDLSPLAGLTNLTKIGLNGNSISDLSPLTGLTNLEWLRFVGNNITDLSPLVANTGLGSGDEVNVKGNPLSSLSLHTHILVLQSRGVTVEFDNRLEMGPNKITGPWLWMIAPTATGQGGRQSNNVDSLAAASGGDVTEAEVAANSAKEGEAVGNYVWTLGKIARTGGNNINDLINSIGMAQGDVDDHSSYALITLESVTVQSNVTMQVGSDDSIKVWLNGEVVHNKPVNRGASDFKDSFKVNLKKGDNLLLVKVSERAGGWSMFVGIEADVNAIYKRPPDVVIYADVNGDGLVNVLDLTMIASSLGESGQNDADVNRDGVVSILDLVLVAGMFEGAAAAPSAQRQVPETLTAVEVQGWLTDARALEVKNPIVKRGFLVLEQLLVSLTPRETELLANYPNPFNPETWIPYRLAEDAFVTLTIYDTAGQIVRTLDVGHRIAAAYENQPKAIHWDGKNDLGEGVASGIYFYTLTVGEYSATRKMVILK